MIGQCDHASSYSKVGWQSTKEADGKIVLAGILVTVHMSLHSQRSMDSLSYHFKVSSVENWQWVASSLVLITYSYGLVDVGILKATSVHIFQKINKFRSVDIFFFQNIFFHIVSLKMVEKQDGENCNCYDVTTVTDRTHVHVFF